MGHSVGEYVAATISGVMKLDVASITKLYVSFGANVQIV
jgi:acyl transferase domain-containing protein